DQGRAQREPTHGPLKPHKGAVGRLIWPATVECRQPRRVADEPARSTTCQRRAQAVCRAEATAEIDAKSRKFEQESKRSSGRTQFTSGLGVGAAEAWTVNSKSALCCVYGYAESRAG